MKKQVQIAVLISAMVAPAFAGDMSGMDMSGSTNPASKAFMQEMAGMHDAMMGMKPTNDTSKDFVLMMKPHHQAAVEMAETYLKYGDDPQLKRMSQDIVASQKKEIDEMNAWLAAHKSH